MLASNPYRTPGLCRHAEPREPVDAEAIDRRALAFLAAWSLLRVGLCCVRGLDLEGGFAVLLAFTTVTLLVVRAPDGAPAGSRLR